MIRVVHSNDVRSWLPYVSGPHCLAFELGCILSAKTLLSLSLSTKLLAPAPQDKAGPKSRSGSPAIASTHEPPVAEKKHALSTKAPVSNHSKGTKRKGRKMSEGSSSHEVHEAAPQVKQSRRTGTVKRSKGTMQHSLVHDHSRSRQRPTPQSWSKAPLCGGSGVSVVSADQSFRDETLAVWQRQFRDKKESKLYKVSDVYQVVNEDRSRMWEKKRQEVWDEGASEADTQSSFVFVALGGQEPLQRLEEVVDEGLRTGTQDLFRNCLYLGNVDEGVFATDHPELASHVKLAPNDTVWFVMFRAFQGRSKTLPAATKGVVERTRVAPKNDNGIDSYGYDKHSQFFEPRNASLVFRSRIGQRYFVDPGHSAPRQLLVHAVLRVVVQSETSNFAPVLPPVARGGDPLLLRFSAKSMEQRKHERSTEVRAPAGPAVADRSISVYISPIEHPTEAQQVREYFANHPSLGKDFVDIRHRASAAFLFANFRTVRWVLACNQPCHVFALTRLNLAVLLLLEGYVGATSGKSGSLFITHRQTVCRQTRPSSNARGGATAPQPIASVGSRWFGQYYMRRVDQMALMTFACHRLPCLAHGGAIRLRPSCRRPGSGCQKAVRPAL